MRQPPSANPPGFFIPYRYAEAVEPISYPPVRKVFAQCHGHFREVLGWIEGSMDAFARFGGDAPAPRFEQDWFGHLDIGALYGIIAERKPKQIIEIGSGHSTRVAHRARADHNLDCSILCIDPQPRAAFFDLDVEHRAELVNSVPLAVFTGLQPGSILFIDSSHLAQPGTDVDYLFNTVIPFLAKDVIIHIHDIFLPEPYPVDWQWRGYNEQLLAAGMITSSAFKPLFASFYAANEPGFIGSSSPIHTLPRHQNVPSTSLWLEKQTPPVC